MLQAICLEHSGRTREPTFPPAGHACSRMGFTHSERGHLLCLCNPTDKLRILLESKVPSTKGKSRGKKSPFLWTFITTHRHSQRKLSPWPCPSLRAGPKGSLFANTRTAHTLQPVWPKYWALPRRAVLPCCGPLSFPTCLGSSELHQSLCWQPCTSGRAPAGLPRKAVWGNATGWLSQRFGVPAEVSAAWEERNRLFFFFFLTSHKYQIFKLYSRKKFKTKFKELVNFQLANISPESVLKANLLCV